MTTLNAAKITLDSNKNPYSTQYDDIYYSSEDGILESEALFLEGAQLPQLWPQKESWTIAETGFGTGLNFLTTWRNFANTAPTDTQLHFISIEKHPIKADTLAEIYSKWPELSQYSQILQQNYPNTSEGIYTIQLSPKVSLTLLWMDVRKACAQWNWNIDVWYLDGFAPEKNPDMWCNELWNTIASFSKPQAKVSTFTSSYRLHLGLSQKGFHLHKAKGWGDKRQRLVGHFSPQEDNQFQAYCNNSLLEAAQRAATDEVRAYVQAGGDIFYTRQGGRNALHAAAASGHWKTLNFLMEQSKLSPKQLWELCNEKGENIYYEAINSNSDSLFLENLFQIPSSLDTINKLDSLLTYAVSRDLLNVVSFLLEQNINVCETGRLQWNALHHACSKRLPHMIQILLDKGLPLESLDEFGRTPLFIATKSNQIEICQILLKAGANPTYSVDRNGHTPLSLAQAKSYTELETLFTK